MNLDSKYYDAVRFEKKVRIEPCTHQCEWENCTAAAPHRAPLTAREQNRTPNRYRWFCSTHIGLYNRQFNFFAGMSDADAARWQHDATTHGLRPTWTRHGADPAPTNWWQAQSRMEDLLADTYSGHARARNGKGRAPNTARLSEGQRRALDIMGLPHTATPAMLAKRYKMLVKRYHPDANNGARHHETALTRVLQAYTYLKDSGFTAT